MVAQADEACKGGLSMQAYLPMNNCSPIMPKTKKTQASSSTTSRSRGMAAIRVLTSSRIPGYALMVRRGRSALKALRLDTSVALPGMYGL